MFTSRLQQSRRGWLVALVVGIAVILGLGGSAVAAGKIGPKQIKKNAVRAKHIKKNAVKPRHIKNKAVKKKHLAPGLRQAINKASQAGPQGPQGEQGETGPQGATGPQGETGPAGALAATAINFDLDVGETLPITAAGEVSVNLECGNNRIGDAYISAGLWVQRAFGSTAVFENGSFVETMRVASTNTSGGWVYPTRTRISPPADGEISAHFTGTVTSVSGTVSQVDLTYTRDRRDGQPDCIFHGSVTEIGTPEEIN